ncbi:hypothetical protein OUZ56_020143 [Daphnia magna]|uniref:Secreted protein n=1 Tax=Daphnia magna TaxID=35525 RepID=A0ABQ9ZDM9_9CRUS|nr:hypothetical protein OUZ56_020143 [Daphnia magna]
MTLVLFLFRPSFTCLANGVTIRQFDIHRAIQSRLARCRLGDNKALTEASFKCNGIKYPFLSAFQQRGVSIMFGDKRAEKKKGLRFTKLISAESYSVIAAELISVDSSRLQKEACPSLQAPFAAVPSRTFAHQTTT